ncbi:MAG: hypothetical protein ABIO49_11475, partial [Dokdonella sp.]
FALWMMSFGAATALHAQSPAPLPLPNLDLKTNGFVETIVRQPDGAIVIGGDFASIDGVPRANIARILPNGTLDPTWNPSADNSVKSVAVDTNGDVYIGGSFEHVGGQTRGGIAKVAGNGAGLVDPAWNPSPNQSTVYALAVDGAGSVYAGGSFSLIGGAARSNIAKLSTGGAGSSDPDWNPSASASVYALALDGTALYAGGYFSNIGSQMRRGIAKLATAGTGIVDPTWHPFDATSGNVTTLALDHSGSIYAGGSFVSSAGSEYDNLMKMATAGAGSIDAGWHPSPNGSVDGLLADGAGHVYVGGAFLNIGGALNRNYLVRLSDAGVGAVDFAWNPSPNNVVFSVASDGSSGIYTGGSFVTVGSQSHWGFAVVDAAGNVGSTADIEGAPLVDAIAFQHGGGTILGGNFLTANGLPRAHLLRLKADGTLDPDWNPAADKTVLGLAVDSSDAVFAAGSFTNVNGTERLGLVKISGGGTGVVDADWNPSYPFPGAPHPVLSASAVAVDENDIVYAIDSDSFSGGDVVKISNTGTGAADGQWNPTSDNVKSIALDNNGSLYVAGLFSQIGGNPIPYLARITTAGIGTLDTMWHPTPDFPVTNIVLDQQGSLYAAGYFSSIGGQARSKLAKLSVAGSGDADALWNPSPTLTDPGPFPYLLVDALAVDGQGSVFVAGEFDSIGGQASNGFAKLSSTGTGDADPSWNPSRINYVWALTFDGNGTLYVGGNFTTIAAQTRLGIAAFDVADYIFANGFD